MTAVEVLEWLQKHYGEYIEVFGIELFATHLIGNNYIFSAQEIVDKIEKYEAEKQKIEKPQLVNVGGGEAETLMNCWRTINQLVDAVNELRGI